MLRKKGIYTLVTFIVFSMLGWLWEGIYVGINYGTFINRGFLHGPWLPIYGAGGTCILLFLSRFQKNPMKVFLFSMGISGILEYCTSYVQEMLFHQRWWDYSHAFGNIQGRVCLVNLILFGLAGVLVVCFVKPKLEKIYTKLTMHQMTTLCTCLLALFLLDLSISLLMPNVGIGITC